MQGKKVVKMGIMISIIAYLGMIALLILGKVVPDFLFVLFVLGVALIIGACILIKGKNAKEEETQDKKAIFVRGIAVILVILTFVLCLLSTR